MFIRPPRERLADGDALFSRAFDALGELPLATLAARALAIVSALSKFLGFMLLDKARLFSVMTGIDPFLPIPSSHLSSVLLRKLTFPLTRADGPFLIADLGGIYF
jgi:hypothetical protein